MYWGLSEAQDLLHKYRKYNKSINHGAVTELNILLYGSGDIRHILQTVANQRIDSSGCPVQLNFFVIDGCVDVVARNLLLLDIVLSKEESSMSLLGRTHLFMDIYGNSFIRPMSRDYQRNRAKIFMDVFSCDPDAIADKFTPLIDLSGLKYKERDHLQDVLSMWHNDHQPVHLKTKWNDQLRNYLGQRYDSRRGAFDWDLHMELKYRGGERVCNQEYLDFRETGIAFQFPEFEYSCENKTLVVCQRDKQSRKTFPLMTDMHTGPYPSFGLKCDDEEMNKSDHGQNFYRSTDITERNLLKILYNIRCQENPSNQQLRKHKLGASRFVPGIQLITDKGEGAPDTPPHKVTANQDTSWIELDNCKIHFLSPELIKKLSENQVNYENFFDVAFIGAGCFQYVTSKFMNILRPNGIILFEMLQLSLLAKDKRNAFEDSVKQLVKTCPGLELMTNFNLNKLYTTYDYKKGGDMI